MEKLDKLYMNAQEVTLKNPGTKGLVDFLKVAKVVSGIPKTTKEDEFLKYFDDDAMKSIQKLIDLTMEKTFGEVTEEIDAWAMENAMLILPHVISMCSPKVNRDDVKRDELKNKVKTLSGE